MGFQLSQVGAIQIDGNQGLVRSPHVATDFTSRYTRFALPLAA